MPRPIRHMGSLDDGARHRRPGVTAERSKQLRDAGLEPDTADGEKHSALTGHLRLMQSAITPNVPLGDRCSYGSSSGFGGHLRCVIGL
jgi:hypothetical protein